MMEEQRKKLCGGGEWICVMADAFEIKCYLQKIVFEELLQSKFEKIASFIHARAIDMYK